MSAPDGARPPQRGAGPGFWLRNRGAAYVGRRAGALARRYGVTSARAVRRADACVDLLERFGSGPVFMVPGRVMERHGGYFRALQARGAELGLHAFDHVDFRGLSPAGIADQMTLGARAFAREGIRFDGFRCPYLGYTDAVPDATPPGLVGYSSNRAIWRDELRLDEAGATAVFDRLRAFYAAASSATTPAVPRTGRAFVEIPCCVPDDIQLFDGLRLDEAGAAAAWTRVLDATHRRGEIFVVLFHPELFDRVRPVLEVVLEQARRRAPRVWLARLREVGEWWRERSRFAWRAVEDPDGLRVELECTGRATVLVSGRGAPPGEPWHERHRVATDRSPRFAPGARPFVGLADDVPAATRALLAEEGFPIDTERPGECGVRLDAAAVRRLGGEAGLLAHLEGSDAPLVRFWRWPDGARSALAVTGDLDALSLVDYAARLTPDARRRTR